MTSTTISLIPTDTLTTPPPTLSLARTPPLTEFLCLYSICFQDEALHSRIYEVFFFPVNMVSPLLLWMGSTPVVSGCLAVLFSLQLPCSDPADGTIIGSLIPPHPTRLLPRNILCNYRICSSRSYTSSHEHVGSQEPFQVRKKLTCISSNFICSIWCSQCGVLYNW